jgi:transcriptional regulator with XRE-family HTH domain
MTPGELVGRKMRQAREEAGLSQREVGQRLAQFLGGEWAPQAVSLAEQGGRRFEAAEIFALASVLKKSPAWFFTPEPIEELEMPGSAPITWQAVAGASAAAPHLAAAIEALAGAASVARERLLVAQESLAIIVGNARALSAFTAAADLMEGDEEQGELEGYIAELRQELEATTIPRPPATEVDR